MPVLQTIGKANSWLGLVTGTSFGLLLIAVGVFMIYTTLKATPRIAIQATIIIPPPEESYRRRRPALYTFTRKAAPTYSYNIKYRYNDVDYTSTITSKTVYSDGDSTQIYINPATPGQIYMDDGKLYITGSIIIAVGICTICCAAYAVWMTYTSPSYANMAGIGGIGGIVNAML